MRTRFCSVIIGLLALCGCGTPEAEFSWNERTEDLLPKAKREVQTAVVEHFGTPGKMVGWQRLPVGFGGAAGVVAGVTRDESHNLITTLRVDFQAPGLLVQYDRNRDGELTVDELPSELETLLSQQAGSKTLLERADANEDQILTPQELQTVASRLPEEWQALINETTSAVTPENAEEYIDKELRFLTGNYAGQTTTVRDILDAEEGLLEIWPPLEETPQAGGGPVRVVVDFGRTMRSGRHLYMRHCMHCHGVTGDGNGPTAKYLQPLPRDYRQGVFKFASTERNNRPQREDLERIVRLGIPGTYMPSFSMLKEEEVADIVEYVRWLSMRGEYEGELVTLLEETFSNKALEKRIQQERESYEAAVEQGRDVKPVTAQSVRAEVEEELAEVLEMFPEDRDQAGTDVADNWRESEQLAAAVFPQIPRTPDSQESRARGRILYLEKCAVCHGKSAEGNGPQTRDYGEDPITKERYNEPGLFDHWGQPILPRDLTQGIYRGGRRPLDIYRRIHQGIPGTPMAPFSTFRDEQIWDIVNYVLSIPYEGPMDSSPGRDVARANSKRPKQKPAAASVVRTDGSANDDGE